MFCGVNCFLLVLSDEVESFQASKCVWGWWLERKGLQSLGTNKSLIVLVLVRFSPAMLPALLICMRGRSDPQEHGDKTAFQARLLGVLFLLYGLLVCNGSSGHAIEISNVMKKGQSVLFIVSGDPC